MLRRLAWILVALSLAGCTTDASPDAPAAEDAPAVDLPVELIRASWPMRVADEASTQPFAAQPGWVDLVMSRDLQGAVTELGPLGGLPAARAHAEASTLYRQAALTAANALVQTYGETPQESDPAEVAHLLAVSYILLGRIDDARAAAEGLPEGPTTPWHAPWATWLAGDATWPPDLSGLPVALPEVAVGQWPVDAALPHYSLPVQDDSGGMVDVGDPGALVALALWHDAAAHQAAGDQAALVDVYSARYHLPVEGPVDARDELPMEFLFGADYAVGADGPFMAAVLGSEGPAAVDSWADRSLVAALAQGSRVNGNIDAQVALDLLAETRKTLRSELTTAAGTELAFHRTFTKVLTVGLLRQLSLVAQAEGQDRTSGILRINAMERSVEEARCPVGLLSLAAWDAGNRYPMRGAEIIHSQSRRYPSLEAARLSLDVLSIRVGRERGNSGGVGM